MCSEVSRHSHPFEIHNQEAIMTLKLFRCLFNPTSSTREVTEVTWVTINNQQSVISNSCSDVLFHLF